MAHFVWYLKKEKRYNIETLSIDRVLKKEHFIGKSCKKVHQRLFLDPFLTLVNNPKKPLRARNSFKNILKEDYQKAFKKLISFFLWNPVPFNGQSYLKQKGPGTSDQSLFRLKNEFRKIHLLVIHYLTKFDDII